jgi:hypothetical protein
MIVVTVRGTTPSAALSWFMRIRPAAGLLASLAVIASTLPLLNRITGPETARNE